MSDGTSLLDLAGLQSLLECLRSRGYTVIGPTMRDGAVVAAEITRLEDLPRGWGDTQRPGSYRLRPREDAALFGFAAPVHSPKATLFPADTTLWRRTRTEDGFDVELGDGDQDAPPRYALFGVRSCDLRAIELQDRVLDGRAVVDPDYHRRRRDLFVVAATCSDPSGSCFCTSLGTGPRPTRGFDLALTEILGGEHRFLVEVGSPAGSELLAGVPARPASPADLSAADRVARTAAEHILRRLDVDGLREVLQSAAGSPVWDEVATQCLACMNCTAVCPTCFCTSVADSTDLTGGTTTRHRVWDSCFSTEYSAVHGRSVRAGVAARYRQWVTHRFAAWVDQFQSVGCVGCGRCITWCPAGIDLTRRLADVRAERETATARARALAPTGDPHDRH
ncbi:MAG TPA: 4Fe-4S dicluster domain-containing protein [Kineosporiaceae bacterium]|nr:4Fe-4S dicluster domain-containing protein [Kineosporiaceae bacterium]